MPRYLSAGLHPVMGNNTYSILARAKQCRPRLGMWVQKWDWDTKSEADALISFCKEIGITDLYLMAVDYDGTPYKLMGYASACSNNITSLRYSGMYPFQYMAQLCNPLGIQVHAWFCMYHYNWWHNTTTSFLNSPLGSSYLDSTSNPSAYMWKIFDSTARASVATALQSFFRSNPNVGIHLDYIRADGTSSAHTATDITNLVTAIRNACSGAILSVDAITSGYSEDSGSGTINQRPRDWVASGIVDQVLMMGYFYGFHYKGRQMGQIPAKGKGVMFSVGFSSESYRDRASDLAARIELYQFLGYRNFVLFDYSASDGWGSAAYKKIIRAINQTGDLKVLYPDSLNITSLQVNQGTNVVLAHNGTTDTVTWAQMAVTTADDATIKANFESTVGHAAKPLLFHYDGTWLSVSIGDWNIA